MKKELIVAFAFGEGRTIISNLTIGLICEKKAEELVNKKIEPIIFTQYDVPIFNENREIVRPNEIMNQPPSTYALAEKAVEWAKKNEITKIWIVAAGPHLLRATRDITYIAEQKEIKISFRLCNKEIESYKKWFSKKSKQWWVQNSYKRWIRELALLLIPIFLYKKIQK